MAEIGLSQTGGWSGVAQAALADPEANKVEAAGIGGPESVAGKGALQADARPLP